MAVVPDQVTKTYNSIFYDSLGDIPKGDNGLPKYQSLVATYMPSIVINQSGNQVVFSLKFHEGQAFFLDPFSGTTSASSINGFIYSVPINLDLATIPPQSTVKDMAAPAQTLQRLNEFDSRNFSISRLFLDFNSVPLSQPDLAFTYFPPNTPPSLHSSFIYLMDGFLGNLKKTPNHPYILGYAISAGNSIPDPNEGIPPTLRPIGQAFTVFKDNNSDLSTINFVFDTASGRKNIRGNIETPGRT